MHTAPVYVRTSKFQMLKLSDKSFWEKLRVRNTSEERKSKLAEGME